MSPGRLHRRLVGRGEHLVAIQFALMIGFALLPVWHPGLSPTSMADLGPVRAIAAAVLSMVALAFGGLGSHQIRKYLTPLPYPVDHSELVRHGVYSLVRHPLYCSLLCAGLAYALYYLSLSHLIMLAIGFLFFDYKASREERWLTQRHPEYAEYARQVRKFIPWVY